MDIPPSMARCGGAQLARERAQPRRRLRASDSGRCYRTAASLTSFALAALVAGPALARPAEDAETAGEPWRPDETAETAAAASERETREHVAQRRGAAIEIDGRIDSAEWDGIPAQSDFRQRRPVQGAAPSFATAFRIAYDDEALYIAVQAFDPEPDAIRGQLTRRDQDSPSDWLSVAVDSYADRRTAFQFSINPAGVQRDLLLYDDTASDASWDAVWSAAATRNRDGWAAEFRIPLSQLRFSAQAADDGEDDDDDADAWGLQVTRLVARTQEESTWAPWPQENGQRVSLFGRLRGTGELEPPRRLELVPYLLGGLQIGGAGGDTEGAFGAGLSGTYGLSGSLTLSGAINPDFGQVEADPSEVNLSADESYLSEKRRFFLEGADTFRVPLDGADTLFYSRRIGAPPHNPAGLVGAPARSTIYGAAKLSGKTSDGWTIGALDAVTAAEHAGARAVEPLTNYGMLRLVRDFRGGRSTVGGALTSVHRAHGGDAPGADELRAALPSQAYAAALTGSHRFADDAWSLDGSLALSHVRGSEEAIASLQQASQRYYQRPDAEHLSFERDRRSLSGASLSWAVQKRAGDTWRGGVGARTRSPGFEINDLGFQPEADYALPWLWLQRRDDRPGRFTQSWATNFNLWGRWNYGRELLALGGNLNASATLTNYASVYGGAGVDEVRRDPRHLRGGPTVHGARSLFGWAGAGSDPRRALRLELYGDARAQPETASRRAYVSLHATLRAMSNLELGLGSSLTRRRQNDQYVTTASDEQSGEARYLLGELEQTTAALTLRASYNFTTRLGLQFYAQPFVSAGDYRAYKEVVAPGAATYAARYRDLRGVRSEDVATEDGTERRVDADGDQVVDYRFALADFDIRELNTNLVFRWEYLPGSALFFIWSHNRDSAASGHEEDGRFQPQRDAEALVAERGEHVLLLKLSHWFAA
ncbi:DUF5916 domain-containing protein [Haliangium ochraceum]|uniref:Uncharacterized protein n=1 Tax=Haliangium ochraceum (strain DSM 14365 / JCM 11303 / SMP-2) TaxID=502025 RepID=D0LGS8_HALO1|nr:DUF5916 domain-containing protein [Haliangium ochraceum]ACY14650.1 conserved hypothetical protein [Haliangium ochraceum DSM 14365]